MLQAIFAREPTNGTMNLPPHSNQSNIDNYLYRNDKVVQACDKIVTGLQQDCVQ